MNTQAWKTNALQSITTEKEVTEQYKLQAQPESLNRTLTALATALQRIGKRRAFCCSTEEREILGNCIDNLLNVRSRIA